MSFKQYLFFFFLFLFFQNAFAQPIPCEEPAEMTPTCLEACIICDIDGFTGRHESNVQGEAPSGFCTFVVHNAQWIAFQAGSPNLSLQMAVSNCSGGFGLEMAIYEGIDCENFKLVSNCMGGTTNTIPQGGTGTITANEPLVVGQYYYLVMDGAAGDNCDWTLTVVDGNTQVEPLLTSGNIFGDFSVCPELVQEYIVNAPAGATQFDWTANGVPLDINNDSIDYQFPADGLYNLCVTAKNACDEAPPTCQQVLVQSVPVTEIVDVFCEGDCYEVAGETICQSGFYEYVLQNIDGCDSIITADLEELPVAMLSIDVDICEGDTLYIGPTPYTQTGVFQEILTTSQQCDSIIDLDLFVIVCNITSSDFPASAVCFGSETGQIVFNVDNGTPPFTYTWENLTGIHSGSGNINDVGENITIPNIPKGTYLITILDNFGNSDIIISEVSEPPLLEMGFSPSNQNGFDVSCEMGMDGTLEALPMGGVPPYSFIWSNGQASPVATGLSAIEYTVSITDNVGCELVANYTLTEPLLLFFTAAFTNAGCEGLNTGVITAGQVSGGVPPFTYFLDGNAMGANTLYENLTAGDYTVEVMDENGCTFEVMGELTAPQIPVVDLGDDFAISLGDIVAFNPNLNNINIQNIEWQGADSLSCKDCLGAEILPLFDGRYFLEITSEDGCTGSDSVFITVNKFRKIFAPNVFSPNADGINDFFTLFAGREVETINRMQIFNRWGAVVFDKNNFSASEPNVGWDGFFKNEKMQAGVFTWVAEVEFIDGVVEQVTGDFVIIL